jgi:hypothetical protein
LDSTTDLMAMFPGGMATLKATSKAATAMKTAIYAKVATSRRPWKVGTTRAKTLKQVALRVGDDPPSSISAGAASEVKIGALVKAAKRDSSKLRLVYTLLKHILDCDGAGEDEEEAAAVVAPLGEGARVTREESEAQEDGDDAAEEGDGGSSSKVKAQAATPTTMI